jgi:hypothetical protein
MPGDRGRLIWQVYRQHIGFLQQPLRLHFADVAACCKIRGRCRSKQEPL